MEVTKAMKAIKNLMVYKDYLISIIKMKEKNNLSIFKEKIKIFLINTIKK